MKVMENNSETENYWRQGEKQVGNIYAGKTCLLFFASVLCRAIVRLLEEDLLHLSVLQVVQFPYSIFRPHYQVHHHR